MKVATLHFYLILIIFFLGSFATRSPLEFLSQELELKAPIYFVAPGILDKSRNSRELSKASLDIYSPEFIELKFKQSEKVQPHSRDLKRKACFLKFFYTPRAPPIA